MGIILFYIFAFLLVLWVSEKIPGLHLVAKPILDFILKIILFIASHSSLWILWIVRKFIRSHKIVFYHLITPRHIINESEEKRKLRKQI